MNNRNQTYLSLLTDAITKKENKLNELILETIKQSNCFKDEDFEEEKYDEIYQVKMGLIKEIEMLDDGFESLYHRIQDEIKENRYAYEAEIKGLQQKIRSITEKTVRLQKLEAENKARFDRYLAVNKKKIKEYKVNKKSAAAYYKNMMQQFDQDSVFYNKTK